MNKLIFNSLDEAIKYSKDKYDNKNLIYSLDTNKVIYGSSSRSSLMNPKLYVMSNDIKSSINRSESNKIVLKSFEDL